MARLFTKPWTRAGLLRYTGDLSQIAGIKLGEWSDGSERGLRVAEVRSGSGLEFTILLDRGMDIGPAWFKGTPLTWISPAGFGHPMYFEPEGLGWLRTFGGGLLTGCGLTSAGAPSEEAGEPFGLHGRLSNLPAQCVRVDKIWQGDDCCFVVEGEMHQARLFGENLHLKRRITIGLGSNTISLHDRVENLGSTESPLMLLYHINLGFPLLDENAVLEAESHSVSPRDSTAEPGLSDWMHFQSPTTGYQEQVFYHDLPADKDGWAGIRLVNHARRMSLGVRFQKTNLPNLVEWKMMGEGAYVLGLEPANCHVAGRLQERGRGTLQSLKPGEQQDFRVEIAVEEDAEGKDR